MRLLALRRPLLRGAAVAPTIATAAPLALALRSLSPPALILGTTWSPVAELPSGRRHASVKAQGAYKKKGKGGIPKCLGAKRTGDEFVIPGNIIYRQRGTLWWPGENCIMGRDHTIHAMASGYVKYYRDPARHPGRKYIGVVFNKSDKLPYPQHAERRRRLGMTVHGIRPPPRKSSKTNADTDTAAAVNDESQAGLSPSGIPSVVVRKQDGEPDRILRLRSDYAYREDNWRIGRLVRTTKIRTHAFRYRKQWLRHRRWRRERELEGQRKAAARRAEEDAEAEAAGVENVRGAKKPVSLKAAKKAKKAAKKKTKRR